MHSGYEVSRKYRWKMNVNSGGGNKALQCDFISSLFTIPILKYGFITLKRINYLISALSRYVLLNLTEFILCAWTQQHNIKLIYSKYIIKIEAH